MPSYPTRNFVEPVRRGPKPSRRMRPGERRPRPGIRRAGRRPPVPPAPVPKPRHYPLPAKGVSPVRFIPALGVLFVGADVADYYIRRRAPNGVPAPLWDKSKYVFWLRHGPNTYPAPYDGAAAGWSGGYLESSAFGPETGKIANQARTLQAFSVPFPSNGPYGYWIPRPDNARFAQFAAFTSTRIDGGRDKRPQPPAPEYIRAENLGPTTLPLPDPFLLPPRFVAPAPIAIPPQLPVPQARRPPSPSDTPAPMPAPLQPVAVMPVWVGREREVPMPPSAVPAETASFGPGGIRYNPRGKHMRRPPRHGEKEKKGGSRKVAFRIGDLMGQATEIVDIFDAAYKAIDVPAHRKTWYRGQDVTSAKDRALLVWEYAGQISIDEFVKQLLIQHVQDEVLGRVSQQAEKALGKNRLRGVSRLSRLGSVP